jgi:hypothetical protein
MNFNLLKCLIVTLFVLFIGCQKDNETISELIVGKWEWVKTESSWTGLILNPQTAGYSQTLEFTNHGIMKEYKNDLLIDATNYSIETNASETNYNVLISNSGISGHFYIVSDNLIFNEAFVDGPITTYIRLR